ncbi:Vacuolar protein sorting-associated protein 35, partial [Ascosphaera atra]
MASTSGSLMAEEQTRLLEEALGVVRQQSILMRKCLETPGKLMDALKCGSTLVSELRTPSLGPKQYYELYMAVFDALRYLSVYLKESHPVNHLADLYELVQYAGNIVPRLYLMITVGTVYMGIEDAPVKEIMKDMMEMCRGVQHPVRGLFLRYYLLGQAKDHLPTTETEGPEGNLSDSISFVLTNFVEMNKLWVRLQHQGHSRERAQRTQERKELELLVGSNLVRLSQLVTLDTYRNVILQPLLEQVVQCRDVLAQEYLLEVVTKVFPDEFHLNTLDILLPAIGRLNPNVDLKKIVIGLMDRLSSYALRDSESNGGPEERQKMEEEAVTRLLNKLKIPEEDKKKEEKETAENEATEKEKADETSQEKEVETADEETSAEEKPEGEAEAEATPAEKEEKQEPEKPIEEEKPSTLLNNIRLYEIFYEQVVSLVRARNLSIQDTMALLVSLANLSLNIYPSRI